MKIKIPVYIVLMLILLPVAYGASLSVKTHVSSNGGYAEADAKARASDNGIAIAEANADAQKGSTSIASANADAYDGGTAKSYSSSSAPENKNVVSESSAVSKGAGSTVSTSTINGVKSDSGSSDKAGFIYVLHNSDGTNNDNTNVENMQTENKNVEIRNENMNVENSNTGRLGAENTNVFALPVSDVLVPVDAHVDIPRISNENTNIMINPEIKDPEKNKGIMDMVIGAITPVNPFSDFSLQRLI